MSAPRRQAGKSARVKSSAATLLTVKLCKLLKSHGLSQPQTPETRFTPSLFQTRSYSQAAAAAAAAATAAYNQHMARCGPQRHEPFSMQGFQGDWSVCLSAPSSHRGSKLLLVKFYLRIRRSVEVFCRPSNVFERRHPIHVHAMLGIFLRRNSTKHDQIGSWSESLNASCMKWWVSRRRGSRVVAALNDQAQDQTLQQVLLDALDWNLNS